MALFFKIIYNITGDFMGVKVNNTNKTFNDYNFGDFFNVGNLYNYEKLIITKKEISGLSIGKDINEETKSFIALSMINKASVLIVDDINIVSKLELEDIVKKFNGVLVFRDSADAINLGFINEEADEVIFDKYGNEEKLTKEKLENIIKEWIK